MTRKSVILTVVAGILAALSLSFATSEQSLANFRFHAGLFDRTAARKNVEQTLKKFNVHFASFFNTGGMLEGLNEFPAENMVKRRVFQDINTLLSANTIMVYDKDQFKLKDVAFIDPLRAVAIADEVWFLSLHDAKTRARLSGVKASTIQVRYLLRKQEGGWRVVDFQVFAKDDAIPDLPSKEF